MVGDNPSIHIAQAPAIISHRRDVDTIDESSNWLTTDLSNRVDLEKLAINHANITVQ